MVARSIKRTIVCKELVNNALAPQNLDNQTQAVHWLKPKGLDICPANMAFPSPYATGKFKRFGDLPG